MPRLSSFLIGATFFAATSLQTQTPSITVGPNVQVSSPFASLPHYEVWASADPDHAGRMIACSHVQQHNPRDTVSTRAYTGQYCYVTFDAGRTWSTSLKLDRFVAGDPASVYGRGDTVFVAVLGGTDSTNRGTLVYRSIDAGRTWQDTPMRKPFMDREYLSVDRTGKYPGRIYMHGTGSVQGIDSAGTRGFAFLAGVRMYYSTDGGTTFYGPIERHFVGYGLGAEHSNTVLTDGTFAAFFGVTKPGRTQNVLESEKYMPPNAALYVVTSTNGGDSLNMPVKVADWREDRARSEGAVLGQLTSDNSNGPFRDRMYAVYTENVDDHLQIRLSYSADKGKTWSASRIMNDDPNSKASGGPDHILPAVAVNKDGVVLVTWHDRREFPDGAGWRIRATASLDGGDTWLPSVPVSEKAHSIASNAVDAYGPFGGQRAARAGAPITFGVNPDGFLVAAGHTTGLVADAGGTFYPVWVDNRTGTSQLWTAPVKVNGTAVKNGVVAIADLDDVSNLVGLYFANSKYDGATGMFTATVCLKNMSKDTVRGPFEARLVNLESHIGTPRVQGADNGATAAGALWNFTSLVPSGTLLPDSVSGTTQIRFSIADRRAFTDGRSTSRSVLSASVRVLAHAPPKADSATTRAIATQQGGARRERRGGPVHETGCRM
ncbi:MAG TPA: sialidase family protein [Gemmatimonadaceae bacterium]|nr:sialidase family protein [Gemmatimonadaceae bacterium]